jgi:hypothetical protein
MVLTTETVVFLAAPRRGEAGELASAAAQPYQVTRPLHPASLLQLPPAPHVYCLSPQALGQALDSRRSIPTGLVRGEVLTL